MAVKSRGALIALAGAAILLTAILSRQKPDPAGAGAGVNPRPIPSGSAIIEGRLLHSRLSIALDGFPLLYQAEGKPGVSSESGADGGFRFSVSSGPGRFYAGSRDDAPLWEGRLQPGEVRRLDLSYDAGIRVAGIVIGPSGEAPHGARLSVLPPGFDRPLGADGAFSIFAGRPGAELTLRASAPGYSPSAPVQVGGGADLENLRVHLTRGGRVSGRVEDGDRRPLAGVNVFLTGAQGRLSGVAAATDGAGRFIVPAVPAGEYRAAGELKGYFAESAGDPVRVKEGEEIADVILTMIRGWTLRGRVLSPQGLPIRKAEVQVSEGGLTWAADTDSEGRFSFEALRPDVDDERPGIDRIEAVAPKHARVLRFSLPPDSECVLVLPDPAAVEMRLRNEEGDLPATFSWSLMVAPQDSPARPAPKAGAEALPMRGPQGRVADLEPGVYDFGVIAPGYKRIHWASVTLNPGPAAVFEGVLVKAGPEEKPPLRVTRLKDPVELRARLQGEQDPEVRKRLLDFLRSTERDAPDGSSLRKTLREVLKDYPE
jgi:hypothetical protein